MKQVGKYFSEKMETNKDSKRRKDKNSDDEVDKRREIKSKRARTRSKSPVRSRENDSRRKRRLSRSISPKVPIKQEKSEKDAEIRKELPVRRTKDTDMLNTRTGGAYIPPARLRMMQAQFTDKTSAAYQRLAWEALKKSIHGHINKINVGNIGIIIKELLKENIVRGKGLLCRSVIQAQAASPTFTNVYAALISAINSRFPNIGELLLTRLVIQFKRGFKRNDKSICISSASFMAHLVNQRVAHEILALELLTLLVDTPTDDSVEVAIAFLKECGQKLTEVSSKGVNAIFEMLRNILHEGQLDKRIQYMIEVMFQVWKDGFKDHPALVEELDLVPEEEQITHTLMLDDATDPKDTLNVFRLDDKYEEHEQEYKTLSKAILGSDAESGEEESSGESGSEEEEEDEESEQKEVTIIDKTETNLVALRRTVYLTINSSLHFEECAHKLMKMQLKPGQEVELCHMFLDCCAEQRTYEKFYGLLAQRFCNINRMYIGPFEEIFKDSYGTAHRLDTNRLRNVSKFFAHLLFTDSISWEVLECVKLNEEDTTSSSRIYIKILFQELAEYMGLKKLNDRLKDVTLQGAFSGLFPRDNPRNTRFSINFFTSIGLGGLTDELREHLNQMPKNVPPPLTEIKLDSESSSDSSSDSSSSSSDSSTSSDSRDEEEENSKKKKSKSKKNNKAKEKPSLAEKIAEEKNERWGHDGFYDTYGKDARRIDSRTDRRDREDYLKPGDRESNKRSGDDSIHKRREIYEKDNDNFRRNRNRQHRNDDRPQRDNYRNDDRDKRDGGADQRVRKDGRKVCKDDDKNYYNSRDRKNPREDERSHNDEDRVNKDDIRRKDNEKINRSDERNSFRKDDRVRTVDETYKDDRVSKGGKIRRDDERIRKDDNRKTVNDDRVRYRGEEKVRESGKTYRDEYKEDRFRKSDEKSRKDDKIVQKHKDYIGDKRQKDEREGRSDDRIRREEEKDESNRKKNTEDKIERDGSRKKTKDEERERDYREENEYRSKRKDYKQNRTEQNGKGKNYDDQNNRDIKEHDIRKRKSKKEHKSKKQMKSKKDKKKTREVIDSDSEGYIKKKNKHVDDDDDVIFGRKANSKKKVEDTESETSSSESSSSSKAESFAPGRYWNTFDITASH